MSLSLSTPNFEICNILIDCAISNSSDCLLSNCYINILSVQSDCPRSPSPDDPAEQLKPHRDVSEPHGDGDTDSQVAAPPPTLDGEPAAGPVAVSTVSSPGTPWEVPLPTGNTIEVESTSAVLEIPASGTYTFLRLKLLPYVQEVLSNLYSESLYKNGPNFVDVQ